MNLKRFTARTGALAAAAALGLGASAGAAPSNHTLQNTFPVAAKLCSDIRTPGTNHPLLRKYSTQVLEDCTALESKFTTATTAAIAAEAPIRTALLADRTAFRSKCAGRGAAVKSACRTAKRLVQTDIHKLFVERLALSHTYIGELIAARTAFWAAIHSLPGAKNVPADSKTETPKVP